MQNKGGVISSEHPKTSDLIKEPACQRFEEKFQLEHREVRQCAFGLKCSRTDLPLHKSHVVSTNSPSMLTRFEMPDARCPGKNTHPVHGEILGGNAEFLGDAAQGSFGVF